MFTFLSNSSLTPKLTYFLIYSSPAVLYASANIITSFSLTSTDWSHNNHIIKLITRQPPVIFMKIKNKKHTYRYINALKLGNRFWFSLLEWFCESQENSNSKSFFFCSYFNANIPFRIYYSSFFIDNCLNDETWMNQKVSELDLEYSHQTTMRISYLSYHLNIFFNQLKLVSHYFRTTRFTYSSDYNP